MEIELIVSSQGFSLWPVTPSFNEHCVMKANSTRDTSGIYEYGYIEFRVPEIPPEDLVRQVEGKKPYSVIRDLKKARDANNLNDWWKLALSSNTNSSLRFKLMDTPSEHVMNKYMSLDALEHKGFLCYECNYPVKSLDVAILNPRTGQWFGGFREATKEAKSWPLI